MSATQPSVSLYVSNLNYSQVPKEEIRRALYGLFATYGKVLDVVHVRSPKARGTAFVVFRDLASSTAAMRGLDGESFYGKSLRISYAKSTSYATIAQTEGPEAVYAIKLGLRDADDAGKKSKMTVSAAQKKLADDRRKEKRGREDEGEEEEEEDEEDEADGGPQKKKSRQDGEEQEEDDAMEESDDEEAAEEAAPTFGPASAAQGEVPNPILYAEGLPTEVTSEMLSALFQQYSGLASLQLLAVPVDAPAKSATALIHYETMAQAGVAKEALDGFLVDRDAPMKVSWAKRG
ncbi:hypothetical protein JCM8115_006778 [Rhodotorula mucilaginosa]